MSSSELLEWIEYLKLEPLPADRTEKQLAILTMATVKGKDMKLKDYMVSKEVTPSFVTTEAFQNRVESIFGAAL